VNVIYTGCLTNYVFGDCRFTLWVFIGSWLEEIYNPDPDLTLPRGWNVYLGIDSVRDKECLVSDVLALR
jgi:hypothetical protein